MSQQPISNPVLPFIGSLNYVHPGLLIRIQGRVNPSSRCFAINLQCGPSVNPRDDIGLHFSPVFTPPPRVVRNSLENGRWGPEESHGPFFPFTVNEHFELIILVEQDDFKIAINGMHFTEFRHRISIHRLSHISIDGEAQISRISFEENPSKPSAPPFEAPPAAYAPGPSGMPPYPSGPSASSSSALPYPTNVTVGMPPYPPSTGPAGYPPGPPGPSPYPTTGPPPAPYPSSGYGPPPPTAGRHMPPMPGSSGPIPTGPYGAPPQPSPYPPQPIQGAYPTQGGYPAQPGQPGQPYPTQGGYPAQGGYPYPSKASSSGGILAGAAAALGAGSMLGAGAKYLGGHHKKSSPIPIGGIAAGLGAAALGAAVMHKPMKKLKKLYKHKFKGPKFFKHKFHHKFGGFKHKGWSSSSSSD